MTEEHGSRGGGFGNVDHRYVEKLLQAFATVLAITGLNNGIKRSIISPNRLHYGYGGNMTFVVAFHRSGAKHRRYANNLGGGSSDGLCLVNDGIRHALRRIDVGDE